jgi:hypothetical protein
MLSIGSERRPETRGTPMQIFDAAHRRPSRALLALTIVASALVAGMAAPAAAAPPDPVVVPAAPAAFCVPEWEVPGPCLEIPVGGNVMRDVDVHLVFWLPPGHSFAPGVPNGDAQYMATVERLFEDLSGSELYNVLMQYPGRHGYTPNRITLAGTHVETRPFPRTPLLDTDIEAEITHAVGAAGWTPDVVDRLHNLYLVYTPAGVQACLDEPGEPWCSGTQFEAYHDRYTLPVNGPNCTEPGQCATLKYAYMPTLGAGSSPPYPNGAFVDPVLSVTWHELAESVTDPYGSGWQNASSHPNAQGFFRQVGDLCNPGFMPDGHGPRGADGGNVTLNGDRYLLQRVYSNAAQGCTHAFHGQFLHFDALPAATTASPPFTVTAEATSLLPVMLGASGPCSVSGAVVTVTGVGTCTITASQAGDRSTGGFYHPATPVSRSFPVTYAPVSVTTTAVPAGRVGTPYSTTLAATPGVGPYSWTKQSGTLPPGVSITAGGVLTGTPTTPGTYNFVVQVTDSHSPAGTATKAFSITVTNPAFHIVTASLPDGTLGAPYSATLVAANGVPPYKWKKLSKLPTGLKLNPQTGVISGTPKKARGTFAVTVQARYKTKAPKQPAVWHTASRTLSITVR